jgi:hypothetical protein
VTFTTPDKPIETEHITTPPLATTPPTTATIPNKPNHIVDDDLDDLFDKKGNSIKYTMMAMLDTNALHLVDLNDDGVDKTK